ncbi:competence protein ComK [Siminovitchia sp. 179-K 8D1 HS]|uniref:competence protein ComK n=1 Tax=Siminovitchia sp. 179-K 8D1 HS TaxID=3142385 RepID=UPI0039A3E210
MKRVHEYIVHKETMAILNQYDEHGKLCSLVMEEGEIYQVCTSPLTVIKQSIQYYGGSLNGAILGAKEALGRISMPPVMINASQGICWFPSKSITHEDCIWFAVDHIKDYEPLAGKTLQVHFHNGDSIIIESTYDRFEKKVNRAYKLKNIMERRTTGKGLWLYIPKNEFNIIRDAARKHYKLVKRKND